MVSVGIMSYEVNNITGTFHTPQTKNENVGKSFSRLVGLP